MLRTCVLVFYGSDMGFVVINVSYLCSGILWLGYGVCSCKPIVPMYWCFTALQWDV